MTVMFAGPDVPLGVQSTDGEYSPGAMLAGSFTVVANPLAPGMDPVIGICGFSPSVVPYSVAETDPEGQVTLKVTLSPGVAVDGDTLTGGPCAKAGVVRAGTVEAARVAMPASAILPASVSVVAAERMKRIVSSPVRTRDRPAPLPKRANAGRARSQHLGITIGVHLLTP